MVRGMQCGAAGARGRVHGAKGAAKAMRSRVLVPELMDDPALGRSEHARALRGLARINRLSGAADAIWREIRPTASRHAEGGVQIRMLDVATGSGDVPLTVAARAARSGIRMRVMLCDVSETALSQAIETSQRWGVPDTEVRATNVAASALPFSDGEFSIVTCSLFMHHLTRAKCVHVMREMSRVTAHGGLVVISDLRRCRMGLLAAGVAGRLLTRSPVVRVDAVRSVRAAFTVDEMGAMAREAGAVDGDFRVSRSWPWRIALRWSKR